MNGPIEGYITLQAAADILGLSRPTLYRRVMAIEQNVNSSELFMNSSEQPVNSKPTSIVQGKKRYISMDYVQSLQQEAEPIETSGQYADSSGQSTDTSGQYADSSADSPPGTLKAALQRINGLERALMEAQGTISTLEALNAAQQGQIDYQRQLLDREQMIRLATAQKKLADGQESEPDNKQDSGQEQERGLLAWIRRKAKGTA